MKNKKRVGVIKASGEKVEYDADRLSKSMEKSGAGKEVIYQIMEKIEQLLYDGITTKEIYNKAFSLLRKTSGSFAARYKLKNAIYELGPSGFPFEKFVAAILKYEGFDIQTDVMVKGRCVSHEVDVVAEKDNKHFMVECKFHNDKDRYCDVKIPLYIQSRFLDMEAQWREKSGHEHKFHQGWIFTNTRFTSDAIRFGVCSGLILIGWDYPSNGSLRERIDTSGLHPITCLTTLTKSEKLMLLKKEIVLCMELCKHPDLLRKININKMRIEKILKEAHELCKM